MGTMGTAIGRLIGSPGFKFFLICGLILALLIPMVFVWFIIDEREDRAKDVRREVAREWGQSQTIAGPFLIVPYTTIVKSTKKDGEREEEVREHHAVFLPQTLNIRGQATTKVLHRSIYDVAVYTGVLDFEGRFDAPNMAEVAAEMHSVRWRDAVLALGVSDLSGLKTTASLLIDKQTKLAFDPSTGVPGVRMDGIHARLIDAERLFDDTGSASSSMQGFSYSFKLSLNGTSELSFAPVARETTVDLSSAWPDPSFTGAFLPTKREVNADGFSARWQVPNLARSVPQAWTLQGRNLDRWTPYQFGVRFLFPVDFYNLVTRAAKYAVMFLAAVFMAVFVLELRSARNVHAVQYVFVGLTMVFFYVLLLSFAEQIGFLPAYLIAAGATGGMLSLYIARMQKSRVEGLIMLIVFAVLYGLLYLILRLEDYALLAGAILGFLTLAVVMFSTLRVEWSGREKPAPG